MYDSSPAPLFLAFFGFFWLIFMVVGIALAIFWIWMLIDVLTRNFKKSEDKLVWVLVLVFAQVIGAAIYYFVVRKPALSGKK